MISNLKIKNFKSHKHSVLEFHKGVNVIVGDPDSGKSNILRALRWLFENRPLGFPAKVLSDFIEEGEAGVQIEVDGETLFLEKSKKGAIYGMGGQEFRGFNKDVPEEISKILNITELNFSPQISLPFLLWDSAGEVGRVINKITKLEKVDEWVSSLTSELNSLSKEQKLLKEQSEETKQKLKQLEFLPKLEEEVKALEKLDEKITRLQEEEKELSVLLENVNNLHLDIQELEKWLECEKEIDKLEKMILVIGGFIIEEKFINGFLDLADEVESKKAVLAVEDLVREAEGTLEALKEKEKEERNLRRLVDDVLNLEGECQLKEEGLEKEILHFKDVLYKLGKCPLCFSALDEEGISRVLEGV